MTLPHRPDIRPELSQAELHKLKTRLEAIVKILERPNSAEAFVLAFEWAGHGAAAASSDGSRSTGHNDIAAKIITGGDDDIDDRRPGATLKVDPAYLGAYDRMAAAIHTLQPLVGPLLRDLTYCQRAARTQREDANRLDRVNSRSGECECCYTAGRDDSYQHGTLEAVILRRSTSTDPDVDFEQYDLCRNCAKSAHGSRAAAASRGEQWNWEAWREQRIAHLRPAVSA